MRGFEDNVIRQRVLQFEKNRWQCVSHLSRCSLEFMEVKSVSVLHRDLKGSSAPAMPEGFWVLCALQATEFAW